MKELEQFEAMTQTTVNPFMEKWKADGKKIIGYPCTYVPEEIIVAAGMMPYRLRAPESTETYESDKYMTNQNCSFCRHVTDEALRGKFDFLDGFVGINGCDQMKRVCDIFRAAAFKESIAEGKFFYQFIEAPRVMFHKASEQYWKGQITLMKEKIEEHFGVVITDEKLREGIKLVNDSRRLLHRLYDLRKAKQPPITGAEALCITISYTAMPKAEFNDALNSLLSRLDGREAMPDHRKRFFLYGTELDDPEYVRIIEDQGALIVADGLCSGGRMFWDMVDESLEPMDALAKRYHYRWSCPRMTDPLGRLKKIKEITDEWHVDGMIGARLIFCQLGGVDRTLCNLDNQETGFPALWLEREQLLGGVGQMKTRVQAFVESLE